MTAKENEIWFEFDTEAIDNMTMGDISDIMDNNLKAMFEIMPRMMVKWSFDRDPKDPVSYRALKPKEWGLMVQAFTNATTEAFSGKN